MVEPGAPSFIVFSDDWGEHPSSCQHLFREIVRDHAVLWVNTIGMRSPRLSWSDLKKVFRKGAKMLRGIGHRPAATAPAKPPRLRVCQPFMLPFSSIAAVRRFNQRSVIRTVLHATGEMGLQRPVVVTTVPNACDYVTHFDARRIIYYCVDDFTQWPGLEHDLVRSMETGLVKRADVLVATSRRLLASLSNSGKPVHLLTHGVDIGLFSQSAQAEHECLVGIARPRVGYFGLFDERSDQELIAAVAASMPWHSFVIAGPVVVDTARLRALPNIHFPGPIEYRRLPALIRGLDALLIPYGVNEFTASISPLKLKEYLATGKPVISTPLAESLLQQQHIMIAATAGEWIAALIAAASVDVAARTREMQSVLAGESWADKARCFLDLCADGAAKESANDDSHAAA